QKENSLRSAPRPLAGPATLASRKVFFRRTCRRKNDFIFFRRLRAAELCEAFDTLKGPPRGAAFQRVKNYPQKRRYRAAQGELEGAESASNGIECPAKPCLARRAARAAPA